MLMLIGIVLFALGVSLAVVWHVAFVQFLEGALPLALLLVGLILTLVGYSERRAAREFQRAVSEEESEETTRES